MHVLQSANSRYSAGALLLCVSPFYMQQQESACILEQAVVCMIDLEVLLGRFRCSPCQIFCQSRTLIARPAAPGTVCVCIILHVLLGWCRSKQCLILYTDHPVKRCSDRWRHTHCLRGLCQDPCSDFPVQLQCNLLFLWAAHGRQTTAAEPLHPVSLCILHKIHVLRSTVLPALVSLLLTSVTSAP